jgi:hypothetical protein
VVMFSSINIMAYSRSRTKQDVSQTSKNQIFSSSFLVLDCDNITSHLFLKPTMTATHC